MSFFTNQPTWQSLTAVQELLSLGRSRVAAMRIRSVGRRPQGELRRQLIPVQVPVLQVLRPEDTQRIATALINHNKQAATALRDLGSCDTSYSLPGEARFGVSSFKQRGTCPIVMRVI